MEESEANKVILVFTRISFYLYLTLTGEPGWKVTVGQASAPSDPRERRFLDGVGELLQGCASCLGHHPRGAAPPEAAGEHLAASQSPPAPTAAALRFPAGRAASKAQHYTCRWLNCFYFVVKLNLVLRMNVYNTSKCTF